ncbi:MAG: Type I restriction-modification system, DNA-methyltransferase subunit M (EC [uncultured Thiotrichaceae bacterium]|uniref:site-specific DNA-methyltransferase (adenine-specific) n=1 Tax=uncultured Thiotrichaceae bacterium TaxID=298394 RepID=A0A6S6TG56_9GAMM|nr:MAG: Type I restriction-modification system, DNA-methyltransferase subunit M (EC [uncultured Thiotrichaceae bacterium]
MPAKKQVKTQTTAQQLGNIIKSSRQIMRKDKGLSGELDRLPVLTWVMFLKFLDDLEKQQEAKALFDTQTYQPAIAAPYRWRDWAAVEGITGDGLIEFLNLESTTLPNGKTGAGLFTYLRGLQGAEGGDRRDVIATVFQGLQNRMINGYLLRDVIDKINSIHFNSTEEIHTLSRLYENMLREMRDAAGDSGEFYTPRPVVEFMVKVINPQLGESVLDPACGTGGFLVEAAVQLGKQCKTVEHHAALQKSSLYGGEAKPLPYLMAQMNLLLHGIEYPQIDSGNSLSTALKDIGDKDRVDVILTNPPFGGEEEKGILGNFPADKQTTETAMLFLQLIMRKLKRPGKGSDNGGRAAVVVPNGTLSAEGVAGRIKEELVQHYNLHTIVRLPEGVFAPYTDIPANLLFFDRSGPTEDIWYYQIPPPEGRKKYTKTKPMQYSEFADCLEWWNQREANDFAWKVPFSEKLDEAHQKAQPHWDNATEAKQYGDKAEQTYKDLEKSLALAIQAETDQVADLKKKLKAQKKRVAEWREKQKSEQALGDGIYWPVFNLDMKNPTSLLPVEYRSPEELVNVILSKETTIIENLEDIRSLLRGS